MQATKVFSIVAVLMLSLFLAWGAIGANGPSWQPLTSAEVATVRGGQSCFWNMTNPCPPADVQNSCFGCDTMSHKCNYQLGSSPQITSYTTCINTYSGLLDCGLPNQVYCWWAQTCAKYCVLVSGQWLCDVTSNTDAGAVQEQSASGVECGIGRHEIRRDDRRVALIASANGFGFHVFNR